MHLEIMAVRYFSATQGVYIMLHLYRLNMKKRYQKNLKQINFCAMGEIEHADTIIIVVKIFSMIVMFLMIAIVGSIPIRAKAFRSNQKVLAFSAAFSGGLFLAVGLLHLLPEAQEQIEKYYDQEGTADEDHFPFVFLTLILSFAFILWIEKIATDAHNHDHGGHEGHNEHHDHHDHHSKNKVSFEDSNTQYLVDPHQVNIVNQSGHENGPLNESTFKEAVNTQVRIAKKASFAASMRKSMAQDPKASMAQKQINQLAPYILQIAIGIHAVFEGMAIGIESQVSTCIGIAAAVICHKWAEGLTLGLAFRQAGVDIKTSTIMIMIQAIMNPIGIGLGWILSEQGFLVTALFEAVSAGTFVYIATLEVIVEEFSISRYKWPKFFMFLIAIGFICSIWFMEQLTEGGDDS